MKGTFKSLAAGLAMVIGTATVTPSFSTPTYNATSTLTAIEKNHSAKVKANSDKKAKREEKRKAKAEKKQAKAQAKQGNQSGKGKTATK